MRDNLRILNICIVVFLTLCTQAVAEMPGERFYQERWCREQGGQIEVTLPDRTRCDCVTETHVVEVEFAPKWSEAIGQALHYAEMTGKRAGIVLLVIFGSDYVYRDRLDAVIRRYKLPIDVWVWSAFEMRK